MIILGFLILIFALLFWFSYLSFNFIFPDAFKSQCKNDDSKNSEAE
jgi:hypothetical protein